VNRNEQNVTIVPSQVFAELCIFRVFALSRQVHGSLTQTLIAGKKHSSNLGESLQRIKCARLCSVTIRPIVVTGSKNKWSVETLRDLSGSGKSHRYKAPLPSSLFVPPVSIRLKVPVMNNKNKVGFVHVLNQIGKFFFVFSGVRQIADQTKFESPNLAFPARPIDSAPSDEESTK
jgi:hypothetical protein